MSSKFKKDIVLFFRTEATLDIGTGHLMRCIAIAESWTNSNYGNCHFLLSENSAHQTQLLKDQGFTFEILKINPGSLPDCDATISILSRACSPILVVDGYQFSETFFQRLISKEIPVLQIDDNGNCSEYHSNLILNPNIHANETLYVRRSRKTKLLLGPTYFPIRDNFKCMRPTSNQKIVSPSHILIVMGGSDPNNITAKILDALRLSFRPEWQIRVIVGVLNPHLASLINYEKNMASCEILTNPTNIAQIMAWAGIAISAGGVMSYELAFLGIPQINISVATNQVLSVEKLAHEGISINLGRANEFESQTLLSSIDSLTNSPDKMALMSNAGKRLIDGFGADRICNALSNLPFKELTNEI